MAIIDPSQVRIIQGVPVPPAVEGRAERPAPLQLPPGQEVRGEVVTTLPNGRHIVRIGNQLLDMNLPFPMKTGESIALTYLSDTPRPTFSLSLSRNGETPTRLSEAGRWLTLLARTPSMEAVSGREAAKIVQASVPGTVLVEGEPSPGAPAPSRLEPGQLAKGTVLERLPDGRFQVRVGNDTFDMALPKGMRAGTELQLLTVTDKPQPTFVMAPAEGAGSAALAGQAKWLSFVSRLASAPPPSPPPPLLVPTETEGSPLSSGLADRLKETVSRGGLFYESHVAEWSAGKGKLETLLHEPQGKLALARTAGGTLPLPTSDEHLPAESAAKFATAIASPPSSQAPAQELADPQTFPLVRQQLALLQSGQFVWQGEAWPGQEMKWEIEERDAEPDEPMARRWSTMVSLDLPNLGKVQADLVLKGGRLSVMVTTQDPETAELMRTSQQKLREGLFTAGIPLTDLVVTHEE